MFVAVVSLVAGLLLVVAGAELLVRGATRLAAAFQVPPLLVGLTVVAYGTSAPEFAASIGAAAGGSGALALGNVLGSNVFNVLFILGLSALIAPLTASAQLVRFDVPLLVGVSALAWALANDGALGRGDGWALVAVAVLYTGVIVYLAQRRPALAAGPEVPAAHELPASGALPGRLLDVARILVGLVGLGFGARFLVDGSVTLARGAGISELVIGATLVAAGTSLPEVAASLVAAVRGQRDLAVGNVVGSNLINLLGVLGVSALVAPGALAVPAGALSFDFAVATFVAVACLPVFFTGARIARWEGALFLAFYLAYVAYLLLRAGEHAATPAFVDAMVYFALPLTALTLVASIWRDLRPRSRARHPGRDRSNSHRK